MIKTVNFGPIEGLVADSISVPHMFTTRFGGVSTGHLSAMNIGSHRGDDPKNVAENFRILCNVLGADPRRLVLTRQTHSDIVRRVSSADAAGTDHNAYPECDALITNTPGTALVIFTADCTPILLHDPVTGAVGAAHAGWRGTAAKLAAKTAAAMMEAFGCKPSNIRAAIGPNIGPCCFETDRDVPDAMAASFGEAAKAHIQPRGAKYYVNLKALNALALSEVGVDCVEISDACTACRPDRYWSHRVAGAARGSQGAIILCRQRG